MSVNARYTYTAESKDCIDHYHGQQLIYLYWPDHLLFCAPFTLLVDPNLTFEQLWQDHLTPALAPHPDAGKVVLSKVQWQLNGERFIPDSASTLSSNGINHKALLTMTTPALVGMAQAAF